jgi:hypothetical protein
MQDPYRPPPQMPPQDPELARLAMEGQRRRMEVAAGRQVERIQSGGQHLRTAIGAYRGSTIKRIVLVTLMMGVVLGVLGVTLLSLGDHDIGSPLTAGFAVSFVCIFGMAFVPPIASQGAVAAEQDWAMRLPFQLTGYFEVLSAEPRPARRVVYEITWREGAMRPDPNLLHSIFGAVDPQARLEGSSPQGARVEGGAVSGFTGIRVNRSPVYRNHRFCASIHDVVEKVLLPLHRTYPIAHVKLSG